MRGRSEMDVNSVKASFTGNLPGILAGVVAVLCATVAVTLLQTCRPPALRDQSSLVENLLLTEDPTMTEETAPTVETTPPVETTPKVATALKLETNSTGSCHQERYTVKPYQILGPLPWNQIPPKMRLDYTLGGKVPLRLAFRDDSKPLMAGAASQSATGRTAFGRAAINSMVQRVRQGKQVCRYAGLCSNAFRDALKAFNVSGKTVVVLGSETPWAEAYFLANGARMVTTVDYRDPSYRHPKLRFLHIDELSRGTEIFDVAVSYSSFEHDGLGRYGDPLSPDADLQRMRQTLNIVRKPGGLMFLGVPNGKDYLVFNLHRVYGPTRFPMLIKGWKRLRSFGGHLQKVMQTNVNGGFDWQLLHVLTPL